MRTFSSLFFAILAMFALLPYSAFAEEADEASASVPSSTLDGAAERETRFGVLSVVRKDDGEQQIRFAGGDVDIKDAMIALGPAYQYDKADLVIASLSSGGTACPAVFVLLVTSEGGLDASTPFGSCSDLISITERPGHLVVRVGREAFFASSTGVTKADLSDAIAEEAQAELDHPNSDVMNVIQPLVKADNRIYRWCGILEQVEADTYLVSLGDPKYKFVAVASEGDPAQGLPIRLRGKICISGRYVKNVALETVLGTPVTVPLLEIARISL